MRSFAAAVAVFFSFLVSPAFAEWSIDAMNAQIEKTNVIVGGVCSGTIIDKKNRLVLTAYHCITGQLQEVEVKTVDEKTGEVSVKKVQKRLPLTISTRKISDYDIVAVSEHLVRIVGADAKNDIALLQVVDVEFAPEMAAPLAADSYQYKRGLKVYAVGNPGIQWDNSISEGIISAPQRSIDFGTGEIFKMFQHSASTIGGNSGGSILNEDGELIGTVTGGLRGAAISFAIPISFTKELLKRSGFPEVLLK